MPRFSAFTPFGMLKFSGKPSLGERVYRSMTAAKSKAFDLQQGSYMEAKIYAQSMGIARARLALERAENQQDPLKCIEMLPHLEKDWGVVLGANDTILQRQAAVAAKMLLVRGARREAIEEGLRTILGSDFVMLRETPQAEATSLASASQTFTRPEIQAKTIRLTSPVGKIRTLFIPYTCEVFYEGVNGDVLVQAGDRLTVQPENSGLKEVVTVSSANSKSFIAVFSKTHDVGAYATTINYVDWASTRRTMYIIVKSAAAVDAPTVRRINEFMSRADRTVSTWHIVRATTDGATTLGPMTLGASPLGAVPVGSFNIVPTPLPDFLVAPRIGVSTGGVIRIVGTNLATTSAITFDGVSPISFEVEGDYSVKVTLGPNIPLFPIMGSGPQAVSVSLTTAAGTVVKSDVYLIAHSPLKITSVTPSSGPAAGGTLVTVVGQGMYDSSFLTVDGSSPFGGFTVIDDATVQFTTDAMAAGTKVLSMLSVFGDTATSTFTYF